MRRPLAGVVQCIGIYNTLWTDSEQQNWRWGSKHPVLSTVQVHYDPTGRSGSTVFFAGEAVEDTYPWKDAAGAAFVLLISLFCFISARSDLAKAERGEFEFGDDVEPQTD